MLIQLYTLLFFSSLHDFVQSEQEVSMGTTIVAVRYRDGIVVGADTRTSVSGYVSNRYATKVSFVMEQDDFGLKLDLPSDIQTRSSLKKKKRVENNKHEEKEHNDDHTESIELQSTTARPKTFLNSTSLSCSTCCICRSGSAADTQYLADAVRHQILKRRILNRSKSSISNVAHLIKNYLYNNDLQASLICAGYDHMRGTGVIYSIELGGTIVEQPYYACSGSGSGYVIGYIDDRLMSDTCSSRTTDNGLLVTTEEEAIELVGNSIELAMDRDGSSGGVVRIYVMDRNGKREMIRVPSRKLMVSTTGTTAAGGDDWKNDDTLPLTTTSSASSSNLSKFAPAQRPTG